MFEKAAEHCPTLAALGGPPFVAPLRALICGKPKTGWGYKEHCMLKAVVADAIPTQAKLLARGVADAPD